MFADKLLVAAPLPRSIFPTLKQICRHHPDRCRKPPFSAIPLPSSVFIQPDSLFSRQQKTILADGLYRKEIQVIP
jgi:hypothetical protein